MPYKDKEKQKEYKKRWYSENRESEIKKAYISKRIRLLEMQQYVNDYKKSKGCYSCPEGDPVCLDFHHEGDDKEIGLSQAIQRGWGKKRINKEMSKCIVICANCHRKLHAAELKRV